MLTDQQLETRKIIWTELSDFYLDTELSDEDLIRKILVFKNSGLSINEIKEINYNEVGPQLIQNLKSIAGVWDGFDHAALHQKLLTHAEKKRPRNFLQKIKNYLDRKSIDNYTLVYFDKIELMEKPKNK